MENGPVQLAVLLLVKPVESVTPKETAYAVKSLSGHIYTEVKQKYGVKFFSLKNLKALLPSRCNLGSGFCEVSQPMDSLMFYGR